MHLSRCSFLAPRLGLRFLLFAKFLLHPLAKSKQEVSNATIAPSPNVNLCSSMNSVIAKNANGVSLCTWHLAYRNVETLREVAVGSQPTIWVLWLHSIGFYATPDLITEMQNLQTIFYSHGG